MLTVLHTTRVSITVATIARVHPRFLNQSTGTRVDIVVSKSLGNLRSVPEFAFTCAM